MVRIKIWDTAGQEQYKSITKNFFKNANGVLVVYDVTNKTSYERIKDWIHSIKENSNLNIKIILIGNKIDLERKVTTEEGQKLADHFQYPFFETSAKNNIGINEAIRNLVTSIYILKEDNLGEKEVQGKFNLNNKKIEETNIKTNKCKC